MLEVYLWIVLGISVAMISITAVRLCSVVYRTRPRRFFTDLGDDVDLPSVSICIPARNEQHALVECLDKVIASSYQRLEIIVFDDTSGDNTSALIKSYASEGVRFVQGKPLEAGWLGKNHALQGLAEQASGTYLLFMDVDTRLAPNAVENMVRLAVASGIDMLSVLPRREDGWRFSVIFSSLRYFWEVVLSRRSWPATASNAWMIRREVLQKTFNGFEPYKAAVQPESQLAAQLSYKGKYQFIISTADFGVFYEKKWVSQLVTSIRLLYPLLNKNGALSLFAALDLLLYLIPFGIVTAWLSGVQLSSALGIAALGACLTSWILYGIYTRRVWKKGWWLGALFWPLIVLQEVVLIIVSTLQYLRGTVRWKGRLIQSVTRN